MRVSPAEFEKMRLSLPRFMAERVHLLLEDYYKLAISMGITQQASIDAMAWMYILGAWGITNPNSNFNSRYVEAVPIEVSKLQ